MHAYLRAPLAFLALTLPLAACGASVDAPVGGGGGSSSSSTTSGAGGNDNASCTTSQASDLPGVRIEFTSTDCVFTLAEAAAGITIDYRVVIDQNPPVVYPKPQDAGGCDAAGPSGLILFEKLEGSGMQSYCICDSGLCPGPSGAPIHLVPGSYPGKFSWDGRNWSGPSDTGQPKGAPFPAGEYSLVVSAIGQYEDAGSKKLFSVASKFPVTLVP